MGISTHENIELDEMHLSAMSEIMNQMIGASATSLANLLARPIDISPPKALHIDGAANLDELMDESRLVIKVSFDMEIEGLLKSKLIQLMPVETGKELSAALITETSGQKNLQESQPPTAPPVMQSNRSSVKEQRVDFGVHEKPKEEPRPVKVKPFECQSF